MGIQIIGSGATIQEVEAASKAARVVVFPQDPISLGYYAIGIDNGTTVMTAGLAASSPIVSFRWGNSNLCLLRSIKFNLYTMTTAFAAGRLDIAAFFARSFTASDTGGATATITGSNAKKRTSFGTTLLTELRFSTTATLTAGTRTLDTQPFARLSVNGLVTAANGNVIPMGTVLWQRDGADEYPIVLAQNEGIVIQATVPATGTWFYSCNMEWMEIASF
jgi:hypothetical protein